MRSARNGRDFISQKHHDAFGMGAHQNHSASGAGIDAIAIVIGHDQAGGAGPHCLLDKAIEGATQFHQARPFGLEYLPDGPVLELRMLGSLGVADALSGDG